MANTEKTQRLIAQNRKARFDYFIEERYEAGLVLQGWEVKAMRAGRAQLKESYVYVKNGEAFLFGAHLSPLNSASSHVVADPIRTRKLLLNAKEIENLAISADREGYTLVPLELYWKNGRAKLQIGIPRERSSTTSAQWRKTATGGAIARDCCGAEPDELFRRIRAAER